MKKKLLTGLIVSAVLALGAITASAVDVKVNGESITTDTEPVVIEDRAMVPLRAICESLNCDVAWNQETKGIVFYKDDHIYCMWIDLDTAFDISPCIQGHYTMDVTPRVINDRTMVPLRAFAELLGAEVSWEQETLTASVNLDLGEAQDNTGIAEQCMPFSDSLYASYDIYRSYVNDTLKKEYAKIELNDGKVIELELYPDIAPETVANFIKLAQAKHFDGLIFHRVIKDFMIQGGGYTESFEERPAETIVGEFVQNGWLNLIPHNAGTISMARTNDPDSASSQFFIVHKDSTFLDFSYAAFGKVISGMEAVDEIANIPTGTIWNGMSDVPSSIPVIKTVTVYENGNI